MVLPYRLREGRCTWKYEPSFSQLSWSRCTLRLLHQLLLQIEISCVTLAQNFYLKRLLYFIPPNDLF